MDSDRNQPLIKQEEIKIYPSISDQVQVNAPVYRPQNNIGQPINQPNMQAPINQGYQNQGYQNQGYQNQGYQNNQPFNNQQNINQPYGNVPNQGYRPNYNQGNGQMPMFPNQQVMPNLNQQRILVIQQHSCMDCKMCGYNGPSNWRQSAGCATYSWCVCLFCFTGIFGFWIPFCIDSCYDTEVMCARCGFIKGVVPADCC